MNRATETIANTRYRRGKGSVRGAGVGSVACGVPEASARSLCVSPLKLSPAHGSHHGPFRKKLFFPERAVVSDPARSSTRTGFVAGHGSALGRRAFPLLPPVVHPPLPGWEDGQ